MLKKCSFHHIGYAVSNVPEVADYYVNAGWKMSEMYKDTIQQTTIVLLFREGFPLIELVEPVNEKSPVSEIIKKNGNAPYHCCYEVEDMEESVSELRKQKFVLLFKPVEAIAFNNRKIAYLYNRSVGLIELLSKK